MSTIKLTAHQWEILAERLYASLPLSTRLISWKHKEQFGFVVRNYHETEEIKSEENRTLSYKVWICLDFYDEAAATLFRLRWL